MYAQAYGIWALGIHIRQISQAHVTATYLTLCSCFLKALYVLFKSLCKCNWVQW